MTTLRLETLDWSLRSLLENGDNSLFRLPFEFKIIENRWDHLRELFATIDVATHPWTPARRFLFPKDRKSFRRASQLDPMDSLVFYGIIKEIGLTVESKRLPARDKTVFSFRFDEQGETSLFQPHDGWSEFWEASKTLAELAANVVITDISEFYNQISHDVVGEQLEDCEAPNGHKKAILNLLATFSYGSRKGLPIGPHAAHLLAELSLVPFDNLFSARGYRFARYIDDIHVFCPAALDPQTALFDLADLLDRELGLSLNRGKTHALSKEEFVRLAELKLQDASTSDKEERLVKAINKLTDSPYDFASLEEVSEHEAGAFTPDAIAAIFDECFTSEYVDYPHLGWILRRLSQVGAPGGIEYVIGHFQDFIPVIGDAAAYLASASENHDVNWAELGVELIDRLELPIVEKSDYLQMILAGLFSKIEKLDHIDILTKRFWTARAPMRREIILAAGAANLRDWVYSLRQQVGDFDKWLKRAFAYATKILTPAKRRKCRDILLSSSHEQERTMIEVIMGYSQADLPGRTGTRRTASRKEKARPKVFLSYSHKDSMVAESIVNALESKGIDVMVDRGHMKPGEDIASFIKRAIASTSRTVFVVSQDSLLSSWVGVETVMSLSHEDVRDNRRLIACWLDDAFIKRNFVLEAVEKIDGELSDLDRLTEKYREKKVDSEDLDSERSRLFLLRNNLTKIVKRLRDSLTLDIRDERFDESIARMVARIKGE